MDNEPVHEQKWYPVDDRKQQYEKLWFTYTAKFV